jgi:aconitate hydratase
MNLVEKLIGAHLLEGNLRAGAEIAIKIDQTLMQDALGTMSCLQFEAMGMDKTATELSILYVDHNTLQTGFENADDHRFLRTFCKKFGLYYSRPGNGICHQVHLERFGAPSKTLLGTDSHTPTCGALGMLAIGAGGLDVAVAMGNGTYHLTMPSVIRVELKGALRPEVSAKDIILKLLSILTVKGGVGKAIEYAGEGLSGLSVYERGTIANMGAELGATTSVFPSDGQTEAFLKAQGRGGVFLPLSADPGATYERTIEIDLSGLVPLAAAPHSPDNVVPVSSLGSVKVDQVCIGSCTNSSYSDMMRVAAVLKGRTIPPEVSLVISPGSKQVLAELARNGALADMVSAGARILESACGPCIGMGQSPASGAVSLRTFNRNFEKRSGTADAQVYLVSPETAAASALTGYIRALDWAGAPGRLPMPERFRIDDNLIEVPDPAGGEGVEIERGNNIKPFSVFDPLASEIGGTVLIKTGDNVTTDHIMPGGADVLPYRSNIPHLARYCLVRCDPDFPKNAEKLGGGFILGGANYGQGSSREHAALVPVFLGVRAVLAKSFARIHKANLINCGILPLEFVNPADYDKIEKFDRLRLPKLRDALGESGGESGDRADGTAGDGGVLVECELEGKGLSIPLRLTASRRERDVLLSGGMVRYAKRQELA